MYYQNLSLKQIAIDRNFQNVTVRVTHYSDCETKPLGSNDRYRYTFYQTYCFGKQVSIDLSQHYCFGQKISTNLSPFNFFG